MITPAQCRAARNLLGWNYTDLAQAAGVRVYTATTFELGQSRPLAVTLRNLTRALEDAGVEFISEDSDGPGVRLRKG